VNVRGGERGRHVIACRNGNRNCKPPTSWHQAKMSFKDLLWKISYEIETICNNVSCVNARVDVDPVPQDPQDPLATGYWLLVTGYSRELHCYNISPELSGSPSVLGYFVARNVNIMTAIQFPLFDGC